VDSVSFRTQDTSEFAIIASPILTLLPAGFIMFPSDKISMTIRFRPNLTKAYPDKYANRVAKLYATFFTDGAHTQLDTTVILITGTFDKLFRNAVRQYSSEPTSSITAFILSNRLVAQLPKDMSEPYHYELYDMLGRRVGEWGNNYIPNQEGYVALPLPQLASGMYVLRIGAKSCTVIISH
jgi:hypothetical protein